MRLPPLTWRWKQIQFKKSLCFLVCRFLDDGITHNPRDSENVICMNCVNTTWNLSLLFPFYFLHFSLVNLIWNVMTKLIAFACIWTQFKLKWKLSYRRQTSVLQRKTSSYYSSWRRLTDNSTHWETTWEKFVNRQWLLFCGRWRHCTFRRILMFDTYVSRSPSSFQSHESQTSMFYLGVMLIQLKCTHQINTGTS
jgi:hypothetical protein